jgi:hypothetical protein
MVPRNLIETLTPCLISALYNQWRKRSRLDNGAVMETTLTKPTY